MSVNNKDIIPMYLGLPIKASFDVHLSKLPLLFTNLFL